MLYAPRVCHRSATHPTVLIPTVVSRGYAAQLAAAGMCTPHTVTLFQTSTHTNLLAAASSASPGTHGRRWCRQHLVPRLHLLGLLGLGCTCVCSAAAASAKRGLRFAPIAPTPAPVPVALFANVAGADLAGSLGVARHGAGLRAYAPVLGVAGVCQLQCTVLRRGVVER